MKQPRVLAEMIPYIESIIEDGTHILKLSEIYALFEQRLDILGVRKQSLSQGLRISFLHTLQVAAKNSQTGGTLYLYLMRGFSKF